jgi:hypothetical protein
MLVANAAMKPPAISRAVLSERARGAALEAEIGRPPDIFLRLRDRPAPSADRIRLNAADAKHHTPRRASNAARAQRHLATAWPR